MKHYLPKSQEDAQQQNGSWECEGGVELWLLANVLLLWLKEYGT